MGAGGDLSEVPFSPGPPPLPRPSSRFPIPDAAAAAAAERAAQEEATAAAMLAAAAEVAGNTATASWFADVLAGPAPAPAAGQRTKRKQRCGNGSGGAQAQAQLAALLGRLPPVAAGAAPPSVLLMRQAAALLRGLQEELGVSVLAGLFASRGGGGRREREAVLGGSGGAPVALLWCSARGMAGGQQCYLSPVGVLSCRAGTSSRNPAGQCVLSSGTYWYAPTQTPSCRPAPPCCCPQSERARTGTLTQEVVQAQVGAAALMSGQPCCMP